VLSHNSVLKILVLGANGQLGSDVMKLSLTHPYADFFEVKPFYRKDIDITIVESIGSILANQDFDVLLNCTSYNKTEQAEHDAQLAILTNAHAVGEMAKVCQNKGARFFHISTDYVFGGEEHVVPITESARPAPLNVYGMSKLLGEMLARKMHLDVTIFRVASLFGIAGSSGKGGNFVETMLRLAKERGHLKVISDQIMSPTATLDIADWIFKFLRANGPAGVYHATNTGQASWYEFAREIVEMVGIPAKVEPISAAEFPTIAMRPAFSVLSNQKLAKIIGEIRPWQEALKTYLNN